MPRVRIALGVAPCNAGSYNDEIEQLIRTTAGDKRVRFLDGETFFGTVDADLCTVDGTHPNDLGFYCMAKAIEPVLRTALKKQ